MSELFDLEGRVAVVTGGGRGIGRAIAVELANAGAAVVPSARSTDEIESVAADIETAGGDAVADGGSGLDPAGLVERATERAKERVEALLDNEDGRNHAEIRAEVQESMTENVNVFREKDRLEEALRDIREAREAYEDVGVADQSRTFNTDLQQTIETRNVIDLAEAITLGALAREEFRGAHWRKEHQERDDENWLKHTLLSWNEGSPELWYKPVLLEGENKRYEPKIRSY